jgi:hypothetical protein
VIGKAGRLWWAFLSVILALAVWMAATGHIILYGFPLEVLEALARGRGLILEGATVRSGTEILALLPGDTVGWASAATAGVNCLAALALYAATMWAWRNPVGPVLAVGAAFFGAKTMWVKALTPQDSLLHLMLAFSLAALIAGAVPVLAGLVLITAVLSPGQALMIYLALAYLGYRRQPAYGLFVPTLALFGVGCLLIPLADGYRLQPGFAGWQLASLLPLCLSLFPSQIRAARGGIYASLLLGSWLTGTAELASILALGDLAFVALEAGRQGAQAEVSGEVSGWQISGAFLGGCLATIILVAVVLPGERYLNREVLIPAHKARVPLGHLFTLFSLDRHAKGYVDDPWRAKVPFPDLSAADCELALELSQKELPEGFCPITLGSLNEQRQIALVYALIAGQRLGGWDDAQHLAAPLLLCKLREKSLLCQGPILVLRKQGRALIAPRPQLPSSPAPLDLRGVLPLPFRVQQVSQENGAAYRWQSAGRSYEICFADQKAEILLSSRPGQYRVTSLAEGAATRTLEMSEVHWEISKTGRPQAFPSRSLIPLSFRLKNLGAGPVSSDLIAFWRLQTAEGASFSTFSQKTPRSFILYPQESVELTLELATPESEGQYWLQATVLTPQGQELEVPLNPAAAIVTWRRLPPVGTWVEEP